MMASASSSCASFSCSFCFRPSYVGRPESLTCLGSLQKEGRWSGLSFDSSASLALISSRICEMVACSSPCSDCSNAWCSRKAEYACGAGVARRGASERAVSARTGERGGSGTLVCVCVRFDGDAGAACKTHPSRVS